MASAWGTSWGTSWGNSWGDTGGAAPVVVQIQRGGTSKRDRKRKKVIRFSDFAAREELEKSMAVAVTQTITVIPFEEEDDDDDLIRLITMNLLQ